MTDHEGAQDSGDAVTTANPVLSPVLSAPVATPDLPPRPRSTSNPAQASSEGSSESSYVNLSYAPRQSSVRGPAGANRRPISCTAAHASSTLAQQLAASNTKVSTACFVSHSTPFTVQKASASLKTSSADSEPPSRSVPLSNDADSAHSLDKETAATLDHCESLGLGPESPGYALVKRFCGCKEGEWRYLADLCGTGEAVLLLPISNRPSSHSQSFKHPKANFSEQTDAFPPPFLTFAYDHILVGPSSRPAVGDPSPPAKGVATLSGLRGQIHTDSAGSNKLTIKSFIYRTDSNWPAEIRNKATRRHLFASLAPLPEPCCADFPLPNYTILGSAELVLPKTVARRGEETLNAVVSRGTSTNFAAFFGRAGREKRRATATLSSDSRREASGPFQSNTANLMSTEHPKLQVMLIDRPLRRSRALRGMSYSIKARLLAQLQRQNEITGPAAELVGSFASSFYPFTESSSSSSLCHHRGGHVLPAPLPYALTPEELQTSFQNLYGKVQYLLTAQKDPLTKSSEEVGELLCKRLESVEGLLLTELYDRLLTPSHSIDADTDENLASRIAAFNVLGLDWKGLGIRFPKDEAGNDARSALDVILSRCEEKLLNLQAKWAYSPKSKLDIFVAVHRIIVDGLASAPAIEMHDPTEEEQEESEHRTKGDDSTILLGEGRAIQRSNTSSADLMLPVLIRLIVRANPPGLASQLLFIQRYRNESLLNKGGESAYCLINFQAAVKFIENAKPAELGLDQGQDVAFESAATSKSAAIEILRSVTQGAQEQHSAGSLADLLNKASVAGRIKGLSGVVNSSFSVLGKVIGSGASAGMEVWDRSSKNIEGMRTLDDIRNLLSNGPRGGQPATPGSEKGPLLAAAKTSAASTGSPATEYGKADEQRHDLVMAAESTGASTSKPSLSDRLANLNRRLMPISPSESSETTLDSATAAASQSAVGGHDVSTAQLLMPPAAVLSRPKLSPKERTGTIDNNRTTPASTLGFIQISPRGDEDGEDGETSLRSALEAEIPSKLPASLQSPYPPLSSPPSPERPMHVVVATSGSIASLKAPLIVERLLSFANVRVQVIATKPSLHFFEESAIHALDNAVGKADTSADQTRPPYTVADLAAENLEASKGLSSEDIDLNPIDVSNTRIRCRPRAHLWTDEDEWREWKKVGDPILHIELRRWADIVLVAPCSANTLAKIAGGLCDDLLTSFLRALSPETPTLIFPAMNTLMYRHPLTASHLSILTGLLGYEVYGPIEKKLACGDVGAGAMLEWTDIVELVSQRFGLVKEGTGSHLDPARAQMEAIGS